MPAGNTTSAISLLPTRRTACWRSIFNELNLRRLDAERLGEAFELAVIGDALQAARHDAGPFELALEATVLAVAFGDVMEQIVHGDDVAFHADDFRDEGDAAHTIAHAADLHDEVQRRGDL